MMHTYVGARYVPKFMGAYDPTQQYEALCVVDNGGGTSYISITTTPPGTPLTDTNYWALYGSTSGAITSLTSRVDAIENDIGNNLDLVYTPDMFGLPADSDAAKLQAAFDALASTGGTILIDRELTIDTDIVISHRGNGSYEGTPIYVLGGKNPVIKMNGAVFKGDGLRRGGCKFTNIHFKGVNPASDYVFAADDTLRRMWFTNCKFEDLKSLWICDAVEINANVWSFDGCTFFNFTDTVIPVVTSVIIARFINCVFQQGTTGFDFSAVSGQISNVIIRDCTITEYTVAGVKLGNNNSNVHISGCDFESNGINIDLHSCTANNVQQNVIEGCYLAAGTTACFYLPQSCAANSFIEKERIIPISIINCRLSRAANDFVFDATPLIYHKLYFDIPEAPEDVQDYLHLYKWKNKVYTVTITPSDAPGTEKDIVDWATFLAATGRTDIDEFYIAMQEGTMASAWYDTTDQKFKCRVQVTPSVNVSNAYQILWKN